MQFWRRLLPCLMILAAVCVMAQEADDASLEIDSGSSASLWLNFDARGDVNASMNLQDASESSGQLAQTLAQSLHCQPSAFTHPNRYPQTELPKNWSPAQRSPANLSPTA